MVRRSIVGFVLVILAMLALATPALAGGWAVVTLDELPREMQAGSHFQLGFMVRQHGKTPTNMDLNGAPLKPVLTAIKQAGTTAAQASAAETIRAEAQQQGPIGHYVVDLAFPSDGTWEWQIALPTYYVQDNPSGNNAAIFAPLTVLPAAAPAAAMQSAATSWLGFSPLALRWAGLAALLIALAIGLFAKRGVVLRPPAQLQK